MQLKNISLSPTQLQISLINKQHSPLQGLDTVCSVHDLAQAGGEVLEVGANLRDTHGAVQGQQQQVQALPQNLHARQRSAIVCASNRFGKEE